MQGGPSQVDTYDPKPLLAKLHGQHPPDSFGNEDFQNGKFRDTVILGSKRRFKKYGQSGIEVSDLFPHTSQMVDDLAVIRSCYHEGFTHSQAQFLINNGWPRIGRPSMGSWILYGLGTENQNLPGFVVLLEGGVRSGPAVYGNGFLPAAYQGTSFRPGPQSDSEPHAARRGWSRTSSSDLLATLRKLNEQHLESRNHDSELSARIESYELAFRMQMSAPEATDVSSESEATKKLYGLDDPNAADFGGRCLLARRLVERGVRFVQVWNGNGMNADDWDGHIAVRQEPPGARGADRQRRRGLADGPESARPARRHARDLGRGVRPQPGVGRRRGRVRRRDHNPYGFTIWMAGGGIKGGKVIGATDELGLRAVGDRVHLNDLHASILALLGLDHTKLTYPYLGRNFRLTDVGGKTDLVDKLRKA